MLNLESRLERLERETSDRRMRFVRVNQGETAEQALIRAGKVSGDEVPVFIGWQD